MKTKIIRYYRIVFINSSFNKFMATFLLIISLFNIVFAFISQTDGLFNGSLKVCVAVAAFTSIYFYSKWRALTGIEHSCALAIWTTLMTYILATLIQLAGRSSFLFVDDKLANIDHMLFFSTGSIVRFINNYPFAKNISFLIYNSLILLMIAPIFVPMFCEHYYSAKRYILSVTISAIITAVIFIFYPVIGPWTVFNFNPTKEQLKCQHYLFSVLKQKKHAILDINSSGIVGFPSFHVILALLATISLWNIKRIRYPVAILSLGICMSTITTGWHYLSDVIGGVVVVFVSHKLASRLMGKVVSNDR